MIDIYVVRDGTYGLNEATAIVDPLLAELSPALARGRNFLDASDDLEEVTLTVVFRPGFVRGRTVEVHDALQGKSWRGKISGISHMVNLPEVTTELRIVRKAI